MAVPIVMPRLGDFMMEGSVAKWTKGPGETVQQGEVVAEIESEKINYDLEAAEGGIFHPVVEEGATVAVDGVLGYVLAEGEAPPESRPASRAPSPSVQRPAPVSPTKTGDGAVVPSTPGARRLAAKLGVEIASVTPSGPRGRVVEADVRAFADGQASGGPSTPPGLPEPSKVVALQGMRKSIADHMRSSISSSAQLSFFLEVDVTEAQRLRRQASRDRGVTIALAHVLVKACAETLKRVPAHNSVLADGKILYFDEINVGLAVALDDGLIVPVLRNVGDRDLYEIAREAQDLATKATEGKLAPDELAGGTFTISVLGSVDGFTPILNRGQSSILGAGRSVQSPVVRNGEITIREMMTVSLTTDHQVIDGAVAASFLRRFQRLIERPAELFK